MPPRKRVDTDDAIPCRHDIDATEVTRAREILESLDTTEPGLLTKNNIDVEKWPTLLRAAVEVIRGSNAATTEHKEQFIKAILDYGVERSIFSDWKFVGNDNRQDYRVELSGGKTVSIEAKGCPDGNNTTIWERPDWADEFIVWFLCQDSHKNPGGGIWSGVATRLLPHEIARKEIVDAAIFWDGRCGSAIRPCPKDYGVFGELRSKATDIDGMDGEVWLPPPCIYLFPRQVPNVRNNPNPPLHDLTTCSFADSMLELFNVPQEARPAYVHDARIQMRIEDGVIETLPTVVSRCWPDGEDRTVETRWKKQRRD